MKLIVFLTILLLFVGTGCHRPYGPFRNMDKWLVNRDIEFRPLADHPKEIVEYHYWASDTNNPVKRKKQYNIYGFNSSGDLVSSRIYIKDTLVFSWKGQNDPNGWQWTDTDLITHQIETGRTRRLEDGQYKTIDKHEDSVPHAEVVGFNPEGSEFIRNIYGDTVAGRKVRQYRHYYVGDRLMKTEGSSEAGEFRKQYYYSRWDTPDSIELYAVKWISWVIEREYFRMNIHGDPIRHLRLDSRVNGRDTLEYQVYQYSYDRHGNWVRKITTALMGKDTAMFEIDPVVPRVVDRAFVY